MGGFASGDGDVKGSGVCGSGKNYSCRTGRPDGLQGQRENSGNSNVRSPQRAFRELAGMLGILGAVAVTI